jgi:hypothetical protein
MIDDHGDTFRFIEACRHGTPWISAWSGARALQQLRRNGCSRSAGQMSRRAHRYQRQLLEESRVTSDPTLRAVFVEDAVSVSGNVIALVALALNQITGPSIPQGVAAVPIALVLIRISLRLIQPSHDFQVGAWVGAPPGAEGPRCCWLDPAAPAS